MKEILVKKNILIVEDSEVNRIILKKILKNDYFIFEATNGKEAVDFLENNHERISLMILDLGMPIMNGYEVLEVMRQDERFSHIPVIVSSTKDESESASKEIKCLALGAYDYISKPYNPEIIKHRIANTIYWRETSTFINTVQNDKITGIFSKDYFYAKTEQLLTTHPENDYDIVCCDIEHFKFINDAYGIGVGDDLLRHIANVLKKTVDSHGICGRIGSDVFAIFIKHRDDYSKEMFEKIIKEINTFDISIQVNLKFGIFVIDDNTVPVNIMCDRACIAKSAIKGLYDVHYKYYDNTFRDKMLETQYINANMKKALEENQFEVYFQPKYNIKTERIIGAEALIRWNNPEKGFMSPASFIPIFEKNGFITDLDIYVWDYCCKSLRGWIDSGRRIIPISVNVSRADIYNPDIENILISLIKKYNLSPKYLHLEITESAYTTNSEQLIQAVSRLKNLGFVIEMDDFGTGYSSLNMLSELPIDIIKLDMKFLQTHKNSNSRNILSFIISLARWLNYDITAEGVETQDQVATLRALECDCAQGYFYAKPMNTDDFIALLLKQYSLPTISEEEKANPETDILDTYHNGNILVVDKYKADTKQIKTMFADNYNIISIESVGDSKSILKDPSLNVVIVFFICQADSDVEEMDSIINACKTSNVPIITVHEKLGEMKHAITLGASDCIVKPYVREVIKNRVENVIGKNRVEQFEKEEATSSAIYEMKRRAETDSLTGLLNRAEFEKRVTDFFANGSDTDGIFIIMDIDNFKNINDEYGHTKGDEVLVNIANQLKYLFPETDAVSRIGGDEFALFIPYILDREILIYKLNKICQSVDFKLCEAPVNCSLGISYSPKDGNDFRTVYEHADMALLYSKRNGKRSFNFYDEKIEISFENQLEKNAFNILDNTNDAVFICDANSNDVIYINSTACEILNMSKEECLSRKCYDIFWHRNINCQRCPEIGKCTSGYYHEDALFVDNKTKIHIKAKTTEWDGKKVKIHYLKKD